MIPVRSPIVALANFGAILACRGAVVEDNGGWDLLHLRKEKRGTVNESKISPTYPTPGRYPGPFTNSL